MSDEKQQTDEMRQCPTCRMQVSVWATKCHHCGEEVGRPRREELKLTLKDLGGSQRSTYVPSGNVTGALESFRVEEVAAEASRTSRKPVGFWARLFGKPQPLAEPARASESTMPELDEYSKNLAASILDDMPASASASRSQQAAGPAVIPPAAHQAIRLGLLLLAVIAVYFVGSFTWSHLSSYLAARNRPPEVMYTNKAPEMLARNEAIIDVFEEAVNAATIKSTEENHRILSETRTLLLHEVDSFMQKNPWKLSDYDTAYAYIQRAAKIDNHTSIAAKLDHVTEELAMYKFVLKSVDSTGTKATFRLNNASADAEETVEVADRLMDRFIIQRVTARGVDLNDDKVEGRKLTVGLNEGVKSRF